MSSATETTLLESVPDGLFIGGEWRSAASGATLNVYDPATGEVIKTIANGAVEDGAAAMDGAVDSAPAWAKTPPRERSEILRRAFDLIQERQDDVALLMTLEMGKPLAESKAEVKYGSEFLRWFSEEAVRIFGRYGINPEGTGRMIVTQHPVGPCFLITPWNFPLAMATGLPPGVVNVITTHTSSKVSAPIIADPRLRKLSFTGSTEVGRKLLEQAAEGILRTSMELGGNAPFLIFDDADLGAAVEGAMLAKFRNIGQACTAANRFIVHEAIADEFAARVTERVQAFKVGRGTEEDVQIGPLINSDAVDKADALVRDATERGAKVLTGGHPIEGPGTFYEPTVVAGVRPGSDILREEIFGPVLSIVTFSDEDEAVRIANDTEYGLVGYAFTKDLARGQRLIESLQTGMLGLNVGVVSNAAAPFGGVKQSGIGREGGFEGIHEYLSTKYTMTPSPFAG